MTYFSSKIYANAAAFLTVSLGSLYGASANGLPLEESKAYCGGNFFLQGDLLYWKARQVGLDLIMNTAKSSGAVTVVTDTSGEEVNETKRKYHSFRFDGRCGFRIGAGYHFNDCAWALAAYWTHLHGHAHGHGHFDRARARGHWNLKYDVLDILTTGPQFSLGSSFTWRAFGGVRAAKIDQTTHAFAESLGTTVNPFAERTTLNSTTFRSKNRSDFLGIGPEVGVTANWGIGRGFSVYANADGSLLYSHYNSKFSDRIDDTTTFISAEDPTTTNQFTFGDSSRGIASACQVVIDLGLGFCWKQYACLCNHNVGWIVKLGWEHSQWFDHGARGQAGDLCFDGVTLSTQVQF